MQMGSSQKGELLGELHGSTVTTTIKETSLLGVKMEGNDTAEFSGKYDAHEVETVTFSLRPDGSYDWETKGFQTTRDGDFIIFNGRGTGQNNLGTAVWQGELYFSTQSKKLSWLNSITALTEGSAESSTGAFHGKIYIKK